MDCLRSESVDLAQYLQRRGKILQNSYLLENFLKIILAINKKLSNIINIKNIDFRSDTLFVDLFS